MARICEFVFYIVVEITGKDKIPVESKFSNLIMSDNSESSPEERPSGCGENIYSELNRLRETLVDKEKEINRLQREVHKLKVFLYFS